MLTVMFAFAWIGHASIWCRLLNYLYGCPLPKHFLKPWRWFSGFVIVAPLLLAFPFFEDWSPLPGKNYFTEAFVVSTLCFMMVYLPFCLFIGAIVFPAITILRLLDRRFDRGLAVSCKSTRIDIWQRYRHRLIGDGRYRWLPRLPGNDVFTIETTELKVCFPAFIRTDIPPPFDYNRPPLPEALEGLTILFLTDFHFFGTPSQTYFEAVLDDAISRGVPDIVALGGDFVDSISHHSWIVPLLGRLKWNEAGVAILGNHDMHFDPEGIRAKLSELGFHVLSNRWETLQIRGVSVNFIGNEAPWNRESCDLSRMPSEPFRIGLVHTPDQFNWASNERLDLILAGHVHGGQIRLPLIGSIFVPCKTGRKYDQGVFRLRDFDNNDELIEFRTTMVVSRGVSGKEPLRFRCPPQVIRITLTAVAQP